MPNCDSILDILERVEKMENFENAKGPRTRDRNEASVEGQIISALMISIN